jgi:uncharacterized protein YcbK (DUF882 family)
MIHKNPLLIVLYLFGVLVAIGLFYRSLLWFYGLTVTSWWRNPANNDANDGKPLSLHLIGMAWDIRIRGEEGLGASDKIAQFMQWLPWGRTVAESDHIHIQFL